MSTARDQVSRLPLELLHDIIEVIAKERDDFMQNSLRPCKSCTPLKTPRSLAITSQRLHAISQPILYRTIRIKSWIQLQRGLQTVANTPRLAAYVKHLYFFKTHCQTSWHARPMQFELARRKRDRCVLWRAAKAVSPPSRHNWDFAYVRKSVLDAVLDLFDL
ncbi:hypothetical protein BJX70DRAFT_402725 [Aspergillus crustosus]